ncbi:hypothetical protein N7470_000881 [Penicillium chermesinum]|nr:hypothetical protein N7470_000881 [Penicillium chermesinum]
MREGIHILVLETTGLHVLRQLGEELAVKLRAEAWPEVAVFFQGQTGGVLQLVGLIGALVAEKKEAGVHVGLELELELCGSKRDAFKFELLVVTLFRYKSFAQDVVCAAWKAVECQEAEMLDDTLPPHSVCMVCLDARYTELDKEL